MMNNHVSYLYGLENYKILQIADWKFFNSLGTAIPSILIDVNKRCYVAMDASFPTEVMSRITSDCPYIGSTIFYSRLYDEHPELLEKAKKIYVHPDCKIPRTLLKEKYSKSLDPWLSDVVVMPTPNDEGCYLDNVAIFVNDRAKYIVMVDLYNQEQISKAATFEIGSRFDDLRRSITGDNTEVTPPEYEDIIKESELFFVGKCFSIHKSKSSIIDVITRNIPTSKIVFEETIQKSLSNKNNQPDFDTMVGIKDMLNSDDRSTVGVGLKALSMLDYTQYPNSTIYILQSANFNYRYNPATNHTSVKFMFKMLSGSTRRRDWPGSYSREIYSHDYELFRKLLCHYYKGDLNTYLRCFGFMGDGEDNMPIPKLKQ